MAAQTRTAAVKKSPLGRRRELYGLLGDLPERKRPMTAKVLLREEKRDYMLEKIELDMNGFEKVPAWFAMPKKLTGRAPAVLYNHAHGGDYKLGKDELIRGRKELQERPYAEVLTSLGYCVLCIDSWVFGERATRTEMDTFKEMLWKGQVLWGMMVYDSLRAIDYLVSRPEVNAARIGTLGLSMGSTMAWWTAALDERIKATVDICCMTDFQALIDANGLSGHGIYYYVPSLLKHFSTADINAMIVPRAHLALAGERDRLTPVKGLNRIDALMKKAYATAGAPRRWKLFRQDAGHEETPEMRKEIISFLRENL